tara:strand:- start:1267 stop:1914 length:648 start_codon:yes stop_codon:yes gene_type:complete
VISIKKFFQNNKQKLEALEKENSYYQKVAEDLNMGDRDEGMWSKAFSRSKGDHKETESIYIKLMVEKIIIEEQLKGTEEEERKKEEEKLEKEREERDRKERWEEERERRQKKQKEQRERWQELQEEEDRLRKEGKEKNSKRRKKRYKFFKEEELPIISIISTGIFFLEMKGITTVFTPWFHATISNLPLWNFLLFAFIVILTAFLVICAHPFRKS